MSFGKNIILSSALSITLASLLAACAPGSSEADLSGAQSDRGTKAINTDQKATEYPEAVLIEGQMSVFGSVCTGTLIAPKVVLTAAHCLTGTRVQTDSGIETLSVSSWTVTAPYAGNQTAKATLAGSFDYTSPSEKVDLATHDVGLIFLDTEIKLDAYPRRNASTVADGTQVVELGRKYNGKNSRTDVFLSTPVSVFSNKVMLNAKTPASKYYSTDQVLIDSGDSGGPAMLYKSQEHVVVGVNSAANDTTTVIARIDLPEIAAWIDDQIQNPGTSPHLFGKGKGAEAQGGEPKGGEPKGGEPKGGEPQGGEPQVDGAGECSGISFKGKCDGDTLTWCEGGLQTIDCAASNKHCAFDSSNNFYNCL